MMVEFKVVNAPTKAARMMRRPSHTFSIGFRPWQLQPCVIAPVLPGDTLQKLDLQVRAVTDPIKARLTGWWLEAYFYYVTHRNMSASDTFMGMMTDLNADLSATKWGSDNAKMYGAAGDVAWTSYCLEACVAEDFRDEGHAWNDFMLDGLPISKVNDVSWLDSVSTDTAYKADDPELVVGGDDTITGSEVDALLQQYQMLQGMGMADMDYDDWLRSQGISRPVEERNVPELLRYVRQWAYPSNTIDPADGSATSAVSWAVREELSSPKFFKEPGFIFGFMSARPKVYRSAQKGSGAGLLANALTWLPAMMAKDYKSSVLEVTAGTGPLDGLTDDYHVDVKDLFLYGDQFVSHALTDTDKNFVALPTAANRKFYVSSSDADALFTGASPANQVYADGICTLRIQSRVEETSVTVGGAV
jgi:hypothetical protein